MIEDPKCRFRRVTLVIAVAISIAHLHACAEQDGRPSVAESFDDKLVQRLLSPTNTDVIVVAHRACWYSAPENSISAVEECIGLGVDMIEIDVRRTKDNHLIVIHDDTVDRTTNGTGEVSKLSLAEILTLNLRQGAGGPTAAITKDRIPTLEQVLQTTKSRILVNLDAKDEVRSDAFRVAESLGMSNEILIKMNLSHPDEFDPDEHAFFGSTNFMPIIRENNGPLDVQASMLNDLNPVAFEIIYQSDEALAAGCASAAENRARCWVNTMWDRLSPGHSDDVATMDPDRHWGYLISLGANMIQTDRPLELVEYLQSRDL